VFLPAYEIVEPPSGDARASVYFLHGILGSRRNWLSFARRLVQRVEGWRAVLVDLRNHGESHGASPPHDLESCALDVATLAAELGEEPRIVVGHSFGGKVSLVYAREQASSLAEVWVLDAPPGLREKRSRGDVEQVFERVGEVPLPIEGRQELIDILRAKGLSLDIAKWMTTNLRPADEGEGFVWRFDLEAATEMLLDYGKHDAWDVLERPPSGVRPVMVRGGRSDRWLPAEIERLDTLARAGTIEHHVIEGAGHWLHTEKPEEILALLAPALRRSLGE
jgi:pimeloyl-ACP methyl ester carboxylesterase